MKSKTASRRRWLTRSQVRPKSVQTTPDEPQPVPLLDQFNDTNGVSVADHVIGPQNPGSLAWELAYGVIAIQDNKAQGGQTFNAARLDPGLSDCIVSAKITRVGENPGLDLRIDPENGYCWRAQLMTGYFKLVEHGAADTIRANIAATVTVGVEYSLQAALDGQEISATLDGGSQISYASAAMNQTKTQHGFYLRNSGDLADDFAIEALP